jgi:internalin A
MRLAIVFTTIAPALLFSGSVLLAQDQSKALKVPDGVVFRKADIRSEGTRMAAGVFAPKNPKSEKLPTIVMSHGWGGTAAALRPDAIAFAKAGYLVVAFDYRGWGNSDSRLILAGDKPEKKDGKLIAEVIEVREVVDPIDQTTDIMNAIHWAAGEKQCDANRIGIWGSSFSGGHVVYVAARDPRVKALVSQVGSMDARWVIANPAVRSHTFNQGAARTQGKIGYPAPGAKFNNLTGQPVWEKLMGYAPIEDIGRCKNCAMLFIIAEKEELFDNKDHAILAYQRATGVKKLVSIPGIKHYGIYKEARDQAQKEAIAWFDAHLMRSTPAAPPKSADVPQKRFFETDPKALAAWKKAGAEIGWMSGTIEFGSQMFHTAGQPKKGDMFAVHVSKLTPGALEKLPPPGIPFGISLRGATLSDDGLKELAGMKHLQTLDLAGAKVTDAGLKELAGMKQLKVLSLSGTKVTDAGMKELTLMTQLHSLNLSDTKLTDAGVKEFAQMKQLQALNLMYTKVTHDGLKELAGLKLKNLWIPLDSQSDQGLPHFLAAVDPLSVNLNGWRTVTDAGLKELGGLKQLQALHLADTRISDAGLKLVAGLKNLRTLDLSDTEITDAGLKELAGLQQLQTLNLQYTKTTDAGLKQLAGMKQLQTLNLQNTKTTDAGLKELAGLKQLQSLNLRFTSATNAGLKELAGLKQLQALNLHGTKITDAGLKELGGLKEMQALILTSCQIADAGLKDLGAMEQLRWLDLSLTKTTDAGLKELVGLRQLQSLNLRYAKITDKGLTALSGMKHLRVLDLHQTLVTSAGVTALQKALPECAISR